MVAVSLKRNYLIDKEREPAPMEQWLNHRLMGWEVLGSHLGAGSNPERDFKVQFGRCNTIFSLTNI